MTAERYTDGHPISSFDGEWVRLAQQGLVDEWVGVHYWRIRQFWIHEGRPGCIRQYILYRRNHPLHDLPF